MNKLLSLILAGALCPAAALLAETNLEGKWQLERDTPRGRVHGPLDVKQDGSKLACTYQGESMGKFDVTGEIQGDKVTLKIHVPGGDGPQQGACCEADVRQRGPRQLRRPECQHQEQDRDQQPRCVANQIEGEVISRSDNSMQGTHQDSCAPLRASSQRLRTRKNGLSTRIGAGGRH